MRCWDGVFDRVEKQLSIPWLIICHLSWAIRSSLPKCRASLPLSHRYILFGNIFKKCFKQLDIGCFVKDESLETFKTMFWLNSTLFSFLYPPLYLGLHQRMLRKKAMKRNKLPWIMLSFNNWSTEESWSGPCVVFRDVIPLRFFLSLSNVT